MSALGTAVARPAERAVALPAWAVPAALFLLALAVRAWAVATVDAVPHEGSAYYVEVARNLAAGRGLVIDAMWSYATPPLVFPRPAFELWLPAATFLAALPMSVLGPSFDAARVGFALLGAALAPMVWLVAGDAARAHGLEPRRVATVAAGSGLVAAVLGPFLEAVAAPDSTLPFTVAGVAVAILTARLLRGDVRRSDARPMTGTLTAVTLGVAIGLAYLARQEAVELALALLVLAAVTVVRAHRADGSGEPRSAHGRVQRRAHGRVHRGAHGRALALARLLGPVVIAGAVTVAPWLVRNLHVFGAPLPGQTIENLWLLRNEQIFAFLERPTAAAFLAQGPVAIAAQAAGALAANLWTVVLVGAAPVGIVGLLSLLVFRRSPALRHPTALAHLVLAGLLIWLVTSVLFPVASAWGTFRHGAGPLLVALVVLAALGTDALVARMRALRGWPRSNAWLAPVLLVAVTAPLALLQLALLGRNAADAADRLAVAAAALPALSSPDGDRSGPVITDQPIRLSATSGYRTLALPDEPVASLVALARRFGARTVLVVEGRGQHPAALKAAARDGTGCITRLDLPGTTAAAPIGGAEPLTPQAYRVALDRCAP